MRLSPSADTPARRLVRRHALAALGSAIPGDAIALELMAGAGSLSDGREDMLACGLTPSGSVLVVADPEDLPFPSSFFTCLAGIDVLGRSARPAKVLMEAERVLQPGGRLALIEPWDGLLGGLYYRLKSTRRCAAGLDPWFDACPPDHREDGNAAAPTACLHKRAGELSRIAPTLSVERIEPFGGLSDWTAADDTADPDRVQRHLSREDRMPRFLRRLMGTQALFILEKFSG